MKILIVGSDLNAKLLAQYLKMEDESHDIYMTESEKIEDSSLKDLMKKMQSVDVEKIDYITMGGEDIQVTR